ncbi:MAG: SDR family NAD(P)-dependent oxidoreductase [Synechococcaceae cyanobacterium SM2_3_1]|nr:SDR family NAD(P)-dependent oxidoreductase [Synechococcaceae cyanobacterium SM2_3_1]
MQPDFKKLSDRYPQKRAVITGAASGLGLDLTRLLASAGWCVGMLDYNQEQLEKSEADLQSQVTGKLDPYRVDVSKADVFQAAVDQFVEKHGGLDLMINNAGILCYGPFIDIPLEKWNALINVNLLGVIHGCNAALKYMQSQQQGGVIVNIASLAALIPSISPPYAVTKAATLSLSEWLYAELIDSPIQVSVVMPGVFGSNISRGEMVDPEHKEKSVRYIEEQLKKNQILSSSEVAKNILKDIARERFYIFPTQGGRFLWFMKRFIPQRFLKGLKRSYEKSDLSGIYAKNH